MTDQTTVADDLREAHKAILTLASLYFRRCPAPGVDPEQVADCIYEGMRDELDRLYRIEREATGETR